MIALGMNALFNTIGAFSSDCYIPNLSDVVDDLDASDEQVSLTIQINWILLGLATPVVGHLSDMYGRKLIVVLTLLVYIAGAVGSALAPTIGWLLAARCVQGVGESVSIITSASAWLGARPPPRPPALRVCLLLPPALSFAPAHMSAASRRSLLSALHQSSATWSTTSRSA